jgi:hypothetical protein
LAQDIVDGVSVLYEVGALVTSGAPDTGKEVRPVHIQGLTPTAADKVKRPSPPTHTPKPPPPTIQADGFGGWRQGLRRQI